MENDAALAQKIAKRAVWDLHLNPEDFLAILRGELTVAGEAMFCRLFIGAEQLKVEMINDVPAHIGTIIEDPRLGRLDSRENILANKITALVDRAHPKDVADIFFLLRDGLSIRQALTDADSKAAGITPLLIASILDEFPYEQLTAVKWVEVVDCQAIQRYLAEAALALVKGER